MGKRVCSLIVAGCVVSFGVAVGGCEKKPEAPKTPGDAVKKAGEQVEKAGEKIQEAGKEMNK